MLKKHIRSYSFSYFSVVIAFVLYVCLNSADSNFTIGTSNEKGSVEKQKGAHIFGIVDSTNFTSFKEDNIEWVTLVSWGFQQDVDDPIVSHGAGDSARLVRHNMHWCDKIEKVRNAGFKVFFKPHLWVNDPSPGKWRSDIFPKNEADWKTWQKTYSEFIIRYAQVAEESGAEMYCLGTEFSRLTIEKPEYWRKLIKEVRQVYSGQLTYAANWYKEYENVTFWDELDHIGIQAYFPLTKKEFPSVDQLSKGWNKYIKSLESISTQYNRKIVFTEMGYKSTADGAIRPWEWAEDPARKNSIISNETQANCYQAFFDKVWDKDWFGGVHIWQMRGYFEFINRRHIEMDFTPQGKPASHTISEGFSSD